MITLYKKELSVFFSTTIGPLIIGLFLLINSLILWSDLTEFNILTSTYASMDSFFVISSFIYLIFIPAISMRTFANEYNTGTIETLLTKPISSFSIVFSKFLSILTLITFSILPTFLYVITIYFIGETVGNLDLAGIIGSYIGLFMLSSIFSSIGVFASSISNNQINALILGVVLSIIFYFGFDWLSKVDIFHSIDLILQKTGILYHYNIMSKGLLRISDIIYFISVSFMFLKFSEMIILIKKL